MTKIKNVQPVYKKWAERAFCLPSIEIWNRGETTDPRQWTDKQQPHQPYLVHVCRDGFVTCYTNDSGIKWVKEEMGRRIKEDPDFITKAVDEFNTRIKRIQTIWEEQKMLNRTELTEFLTHLREVWPWYEVVWWAMDMADPESEMFQLTKEARVSTGNMNPYTEVVIRKSLCKMYPKLGTYVDFLLTEEIANDRPPPIEELKERRASYAYADATLFTGQGVTEMEKRFNIRIELPAPVDSSLKEFKGKIACPGIVRGRVRRVMSREDVPNVRKGEIIVSPMTMPDYMPALKKAVGIVTDEGGIVSHAAITARELKKPCIIGTKIATQVLKDGDVVEVDADNGIVRKI